MRLVHTSDWHLGHRLHGASREAEHARFLGWLLDLLEERAADALLIAGDIFDTANPPSAALEQWYRFLRDARRRMPDLDIVVIGGNHDSAARLEAPRPLLAAIDVALVGGLPGPDLDACLVPLTKGGAVRAWVAAVPFLRPADLPRVEGDGDPLVEGVREVYRRVLELAFERAGDDAAVVGTAAVVGMGHLYMTGTQLSELSERRVLGGNQHALPADIFPDAMAYGALGHLHKAQQVGRESVRYSGSPIPLSMTERGYAHQVLVVDLDGPRLGGVDSVRVPRAVPFLRVPETGHGTVEDVLDALAGLVVPPADEDLPPPFLEVAVRLERPEPTLRRQVDDALADTRVRLARIVTEYTGDGAALGGDGDLRTLDEIGVDDVFAAIWRRSHDGDPPTAMVDALHELLDGLRGDPVDAAESAS